MNGWIIKENNFIKEVGGYIITITTDLWWDTENSVKLDFDVIISRLGKEMTWTFGCIEKAFEFADEFVKTNEAGNEVVNENQNKS